MFDLIMLIVNNPAGIYFSLSTVENTRTLSEACSKLTIKTPERRQYQHSGIFIVNFEQISHIFLVLTLSK